MIIFLDAQKAIEDILGAQYLGPNEWSPVVAKWTEHKLIVTGGGNYEANWAIYEFSCLDNFDCKFRQLDTLVHSQKPMYGIIFHEMSTIEKLIGS